MTILFNHDEPASTGSPPGLRHTDAARIKIILVDDDADYREAAGTELDYLGFDVVALDNGDTLFDALDEHADAAMIVLDWKLAGGMGLDLLSPLRQRGCRLPVIFLTGMPATAHESAALDNGAIDFVDKARGLTILAKRIRSGVALVSRQPLEHPPEPLQCGLLLLRPTVSTAEWKGVSPGLTVTEFNIVQLLVSRAGDYVTYRAIYDCVHRPGFVAGDGAEGYRTNVRSSIKRIRNKFRALDAAFCEIENFAAFGYRWRTAAPWTVEPTD